jgi:hypothetical protein
MPEGPSLIQTTLSVADEVPFSSQASRTVPLGVNHLTFCRLAPSQEEIEPLAQSTETLT